MIPTKITINLHENYAQVVVRFTKETSMSYVEYALCGADVFPLLLESIGEASLRNRLSAYEETTRDVTKVYLDGFLGHFSLTYEVYPDNIALFNVTEARSIRPVSGGMSVLGGFTNPAFKGRIFANLIIYQ